MTVLTSEPAQSPAGIREDEPRTVLLTGGTGYVGGRLLHRLEGAGHRVRCLTRRPDALATRTGPNTEVVACDVLDASSLRCVMEGIDTAY
jgi:uncharacterized protein YbjT (DUF2867 family)